MRTQTDGVDAGVGAQVSARIAEMTRLKTGAEVLSADQITTLLDHERDKQLVGCEQDSCLAEVADALGADVIVAARLSRIDGGYALTITALDASRPPPPPAALTPPPANVVLAGSGGCLGCGFFLGFLSSFLFWFLLGFLLNFFFNFL
jgi:hypothetical protein